MIEHTIISFNNKGINIRKNVKKCIANILKYAHIGLFPIYQMIEHTIISFNNKGINIKKKC
jgi:hypothetical protein